ncbi:MAG: DNA polymerase III subunit gamma/tau [Candidatus Portiera sp.]|nr:DNA polymerase III subunit gamma/tau [Portiera sp.]
MLSRVLAIKWRPTSFSGLVGQQHITKTLTNALNSQRLHHAYLFCGTRGIGKTTVARILAKSLSCEKGILANACNECSTCKSIDAGNYSDLIEVDAASRTKVESTRELLDDMQFAPTKGRYKIYLIDEVHMLSNHSFNALLKSLEAPPPHIIFIFATTEPQKLPVTVLSRCLKFNLKALDKDIISSKLREILPQEEVNFDEESLKLISHYAAGSMRDALSLTDQAIAYCDSNLQGKLVAEMLGVTGIVEATVLLEYIEAGDLNKIISVMKDMEKAGANFVELWDRMMLAIQDLTLVSLKFQDEQPKELIALADKFSKEELQILYQIALNTKRELPWAPSMRSASEMAFVRMLTMQPLVSSITNHKKGVSIPSRLPAELETPAAEELVAEATPVMTKELVAEETPVMTKELVAEETPVMTEELVAEETPVMTKELVAEATPVMTKELVAEETPVMTEELVAEETPAIAVAAEEPVEEADTPIDNSFLSLETPSADTPVDVIASVPENPNESDDSTTSIPESSPTNKITATADKPADTKINSATNSNKNDYTQANVWAELVDELELTGMAESIIGDTRLAEIHGGIWILHCISNVRSMFTNGIISTIENAVFDKIHQTIQIQVEVGPVERTPAMLINIRRKEIMEQIKQEPIVNNLINKLGGEVIEESVKSIGRST